MPPHTCYEVITQRVKIGEAILLILISNANEFDAYFKPCGARNAFQAGTAPIFHVRRARGHPVGIHPMARKGANK